MRLQPRLEGAEQFLPDVGRVADDDIEAALGEDFGEGGLPIEGFRMDGTAADDAVVLADGVVEAGLRIYDLRFTIDESEA